MFKLISSVVLTLTFALAAQLSNAQERPKVVVIPLEGQAGLQGPVGASGAPGYILGRSSQTSSGRFAFNGANGTSAATEMCKATFTSEPTAHLCSHMEIQNSLSTGQYSQTGTIDQTISWTVTSSGYSGATFPGSKANSCYNLTYNSGDIARGTRISINLNDTSPGNGGGVSSDTFDIRSEISCNSNLPVMCCR